ncbi:beta-L-arabinofuranosidase domain-containing protein [Microbacterium sp. NPDC055357]
MTTSPSRSIREFPLADVTLLEGSVFVRARDEMLHLARTYPIDRLLAVFRANAGLDTRGASAPGAWEDFGHPDEQPWSEHDYPGREGAPTANLLRGHYAGHFLSMLSFAAAGEGDQALRAKVDEMVAGLAEVQQALAATGRFSHPGFLAAYGEWQFSRLEHFAPYGEIWAPYYTCHKIMAGLLDAHELTGSGQALEVVTAMGHWVHGRLSLLDDTRRQRMWSLYIAGEFGGMNETMARLSAVADEPLFLETARLFDQSDVLDAGAAGEDILDGMHANQHLPQLIGYVHEYELTRDRRYLDAAIGMWNRVVPGRIYAHGGTGESELWGPADVVAGDIGHRNAETCATYNLLKLARLLFAHTLDPAYMEYYERGLLNHILGSRRDARSDTSPEVTYMFPVHPGALPEYDNIGTCCGGTGLENHVTHQSAVFFRGTGSRPELWVNLYTPAELRWREHGVTVRMETDLPFAGRVRLRMEPTDAAGVPVTVHARIPSWVIGEPTARIAGEEIALAAGAGEYATVTRTWAPGDELELDLPMGLRAAGTIDDPRLQNVSFGPSVLVARSDATTLLDVALHSRRTLRGTILADDPSPAAALERDGAVRIGGLPFTPVWTGADERYHMYVRADDETIAFAGADTGVAARRRADGGSVLDDVWAEPVPTTRPAFLARVMAAVERGCADGVLGGSEAKTVLRAALEADPFGPGPEPGESIADVEAARREVQLALGRLDDAAPSAPAVELIVHPDAAPSGWHLQRPSVEVKVQTWGEDDADPVVEVRIDDGPWSRYDRPVVLDREGTIRVEARAVASGRTGVAVRTLHIDTVAPVTTATVARLGAAVEITFTARDDMSGVERIQWQGEGTFIATFQEAFVRALGDEEQVIVYTATDRAGNEEPRRRLVLPSRE